MPNYTNPWVDNAVAGTDLAKTAPADFNQIRLDVHQRMNDVVKDWTADPVVIKDNITGAATGKVAYISGFGFNYGALTNGQTVTYSGNGTIVAAGGVTPAVAPPSLFASLTLPQGITITRLTALVDGMTAGSNLVLTLGNVLQLPIPTAPLSVTASPLPFPGPQPITSGIINYVNGTAGVITVPGNAFWISAICPTVTTSFQIYWVAITYSTPSSQNTL